MLQIAESKNHKKWKNNKKYSRKKFVAGSEVAITSEAL
jgi:hypothetical protein